MYRNVNTGKVLKLKGIELVKTYPEPVRVAVFENGERWAIDLFYKHFRKVDSDPCKSARSKTLTESA